MVAAVGGSPRNRKLWEIRFTEVSWGPAGGFPGGPWWLIGASGGPLGSLTGLLGASRWPPGAS
eukprot:4333514-Pyramimonas_sp.AAC.1